MRNTHSMLTQFVACSALALMLTTAANDAQAAGRAHARAAGANSSVVRTSQRTRTETGWTRSSSATNAAGQTATRNATGTRDAASGVTTINRDYTTFNGGTGSYTGTRSHTDAGMVASGTATLPDGSTVQHSATRVCDKASRSCTKSSSNTRN